MMTAVKEATNFLAPVLEIGAALPFPHTQGIVQSVTDL